MEEPLSEVARSEAGSVTDSRPVRDAFAKAYQFRRADEAMAAGMHPYFKPIASQDGGTVIVNDREMVITGSNDYLGLTQDPRLKEAARRSLDYFGTSCTGSRFLTGTLSLHEELEHRLATFLNKEAALTFSAGYLGCLSVISALAGRHDILYFDRENHASLYDAARLSYATLRKYEHNDMADLERLLRIDEDKPGGRIIVTDGVFSMSGHIANLPRLVALRDRFGARLIVDDAHASGVLGAHGRGTGEHHTGQSEGNGCTFHDGVPSRWLRTRGRSKQRPGTGRRSGRGLRLVVCSSVITHQTGARMQRFSAAC